MRTLVISDIHGNAEALRKIMDTEKYDEVWFLGDFTDYGPEPEIVYDILRDLKPEVWIMGNHDYANAFGVDCRCGEKTHELSVYTRENVTQKILDRDTIREMRDIPIKRTLDLDNGVALFVHGCPRDPLYGYMTRPEEECLANEIGRRVDENIIVFGHTHHPLNQETLGKIFFNPGSVGQPRDGDPRASYGIYSEGSFEIKRVEYDVEKVISKIRSLNMEKKYEEMLIRILREGRV